MVLDLNRALLYADAGGTLHDEPVRRFFSVVDAIIAGEGNGPLDASPRHLGAIAVGLNPAAVDAACAAVMGFDVRRMPMIAGAFCAHRHAIAQFDTTDIRILGRIPGASQTIDEVARSSPSFIPHFGWRNRLEWTPRNDGRLSPIGETS